MIGDVGAFAYRSSDQMEDQAACLSREHGTSLV